MKRDIISPVNFSEFSEQKTVDVLRGGLKLFVKRNDKMAYSTPEKASEYERLRRKRNPVQRRAAEKRYKERNREAVYARIRAWAKRNPEKTRRYAAICAAKNPVSRIYITAKLRAKKYGIEFTITREDIKVPMHCPVFGFPLVPGTGISGRAGGNFNSPSLDKIDPSKGYIPGNIQVISHLANMMKHNATASQLRQFAEWILRQ